MDSIKEISDWGTHVPVFRQLFELFDIKKILEFGMGEFSTRLFMDNNPELLISIESNREWFDKMKTGKPNHQAFCLPENEFVEVLNKYGERYFDVIFVDGPVSTRKPTAELAFKQSKARFVVIHDRTDRTYGFDKMTIPDTWYERMFKTGDFTSITSVSCEDRLLSKIIKNLMGIKVL